MLTSVDRGQDRLAYRCRSALESAERESKLRSQRISASKLRVNGSRYMVKVKR